VVITTGWNAYAHTGSSWDGYDLAKALGHTITPLGPSLNSFLVQEEWVKACSGISFQNACLKSASVDNTIDNAMKWSVERPVSGPLLFTHFGISWPVTFSYSSQIPHIAISQSKPHTVLVQPFEDRNEQWRNERLTKQALEQSKKQLATILHQEFSDRWLQAFLLQYNFQWATSIGNFPREEKKALAKLLGNGIPLTLIARRPWDEFVTAGWVNTGEVNPKTMESKICPWLYFAGEVLNVDAVTGGFNFQACWAEGRCAGESIGTN
jgi:predicted Rossmann fold flavoprotein